MDDFDIKNIQNIFQIAHNIFSNQDIDLLLKKIGSSAENLINAQASSIMLLEDYKQSLYFKVATGEKGGIVQKMRVKVGQGIAGWVAENKKCLIVNDVSKDSRFMPEIDSVSGFVTKSILCVPMFIADELIGVMEVLNKKNGEEFSQTDRILLESLSSIAAISIYNAKISDDQRNFFANIFEILVLAIESRDKKLSGHSWRVAQMATDIARNLNLSEQDYKNIYYGAILHDIGLLQIKDDISVCDGIITIRGIEPETKHPILGADIIKNIKILKGTIPIIKHHHENYDGTGFPDNLSGENIPIGARIVSLCENIDEMFIGGFSEEKIRQMIQLGQETKFDPNIVSIYIKYVNKDGS